MESSTKRRDRGCQRLLVRKCISVVAKDEKSPFSRMPWFFRAKEANAMFAFFWTPSRMFGSRKTEPNDR